VSNGRPAEAEAALAAAGLGSVSRETLARLARFVAMLRQWQRVQNLVGPSALEEIWTRHIADSTQLLTVAPEARRWLDLGSGAGFPGIVVAIVLAETPGATVHLVESNGRKCAFLREVARELELPVTVHRGRIEVILDGWSEPIDAISARGLAPMAQLVKWLEPLLEAGIPAFLHKGLDFRAEWEAIPHRERYDLVEHPSRFGSGVVVELRAADGGHLET
jgi:16S rRNA (guanine527-N7)-methyltransferase